VRLTRVGNILTAFVSANGTTWTQVGSPVTITMAPAILGGLAMTSHADPALGAATFDSVSVAAVPNPWQTTDIGTVGAAGSAVAVNGVFSVSGSGADIWGTADEFRYVYQTLTGDCDVRARVTSQTNNRRMGKGGRYDSWHHRCKCRTRHDRGHTGERLCLSISCCDWWLEHQCRRPGVEHGAKQLGAPRSLGQFHRRLYFGQWDHLDPVGSNVTISFGSSVVVGLAVDSANDGVLSTATFDNILVGGPIPSPWISADVGAVAAAGSAFYNAGTYTVSGSGADIWSTADEFRFVQQPVTGNFDLRARVVSQTNTNGYAKAGVMIRMVPAIRRRKS